jgi:hypothetical protein
MVVPPVYWRLERVADDQDQDIAPTAAWLRFLNQIGVDFG